VPQPRGLGFYLKEKIIMDRSIVYPSAIPLETDVLQAQKNAMIGMAKYAGAILGTGTLLNGLACTPNSPAALNVLVAPGEIYSLQNVDSTAFGSLAADTTHNILKCGISLDTVTLSTPAPTTSGFSVNYLIQVAFSEVDSVPVVLPYYNAANPAIAYSGPANSGASQNTIRKDTCVIAVKTGVAATTGTQTTPAPDAGYTGTYVVTVANGATTVVSGNISLYPGAPFIAATLPQLVHGTQKFTSNGAFTVPNNVTTIYVSAVAGGGGGAAGASSSTTLVAAGGAGGGNGNILIKQQYTVTPGQVIALTIGGAGAPGAYGAYGTNGGAGSTGGNTLIGSLATLTGGGAGAGGNVGSTWAAGGVVSGYSNAGNGQAVILNNQATAQGGNGGGGPFGGAGTGGSYGNSTQSIGYGAGGAGGAGSYAATNTYGTPGQPGMPGLVIIEW
jgi:hypothetical protein